MSFECGEQVGDLFGPNNNKGCNNSSCNISAKHSLDLVIHLPDHLTTTTSKVPSDVREGVISKEFQYYHIYSVLAGFKWAQRHARLYKTLPQGSNKTAPFPTRRIPRRKDRGL